MKKFKVEVLAEIKTFEVLEVIIEAETLAEAQSMISDDWKKHYDELSCIEELAECRQDTGYYEVREDTLEEVI